MFSPANQFPSEIPGTIIFLTVISLIMALPSVILHSLFRLAEITPRNIGVANGTAIVFLIASLGLIGFFSYAIPKSTDGLDGLAFLMIWLVAQFIIAFVGLIVAEISTLRYKARNNIQD